MIRQIEDHTGKSVEELRKLNIDKDKSKSSIKNLINIESVDEIESGVQEKE